MIAFFALVGFMTACLWGLTRSFGGAIVFAAVAFPLVALFTWAENHDRRMAAECRDRGGQPQYTGRSVLVCFAPGVILDPSQSTRR
jgi:hypothetical protein